MQREISEGVKLAFEIIMAAAIIGIVAMFGFIAHKSELIVENDRMTKVYMQGASQLYYYNNKVVKGSDVVDCIVTYPRTYIFKIVIGDTTYNFDHATEIASGEGLNLWSLDYIGTIIKATEMNNSFKSEFILNDTGDVIEGIRFEME